MTTSGPGCGFHHSVLCGLSLLPSERSRLTIKEKISLNKLVVLFFFIFFSFLCPGPVVGKSVGDLIVLVEEGDIPGMGALTDKAEGKYEKVMRRKEN